MNKDIVYYEKRVQQLETLSAELLTRLMREYERACMSDETIEHLRAIIAELLKNK